MTTTPPCKNMNHKSINDLHRGLVCLQLKEPCGKLHGDEDLLDSTKRKNKTKHRISMRNWRLNLYGSHHYTDEDTLLDSADQKKNKMKKRNKHESCLLSLHGSRCLNYIFIPLFFSVESKQSSFQSTFLNFA